MINRLTLGIFILLLSVLFPPPGLTQDDTSRITLSAEALLKEGGLPLEGGVNWRLFGSDVDDSGRLPLIYQTDKGRMETRQTPGDYVLSVSYGTAVVSRKLTLADAPQAVTLILNAGGIRFSGALATGGSIRSGQLRNAIIPANSDEPLIRYAEAEKFYRVPAGDYRIVSRYGGGNAISETEITVEAGKLSETVVYHHAGDVTLTLIREVGGKAQLNTSWELLALPDKRLPLINSAVAKLILAEGRYRAIAHHENKRYVRDFLVRTGDAITVNVLMSQ